MVTAPARAGVLLGYGGRPRPPVPRTLVFDPGPSMGILLVEGHQPIDGAIVCLAAVEGWRPDLPRERTWWLAKRYAKRVKRTADAILARYPGIARLAVEGANPPAPVIRRRNRQGVYEARPINREMIHALYVVQFGIGLVLGRYLPTDERPGAVIVVPPGRGRGEWHKPEHGGAGKAAEVYPRELRGGWTERFLTTDGPTVEQRTGTDPTKGKGPMHHLRECFDIATDAETQWRQEGGARA